MQSVRADTGAVGGGWIAAEAEAALLRLGYGYFANGGLCLCAEAGTELDSVVDPSSGEVVYIANVLAAERPVDWTTVNP